ncbi:MAG: FAD-dependent oxidoreductase, partial [Chloroflexi bacterium]|nr:FAD-dependent oxidoreductase [Chloroflexota bacterium]
QPLLGPIDELAGYVQAVGFSGHGFMVAPITGQLIAEHIVRGVTSLPTEGLGMGRFAAGALAHREASVV